MKRIATLLSVIVLGFSSCSKDEVIEKDYTLKSEVISFNSTEGDNTAQTFVKLNDFTKNVALTTSSTDYVNFYIVRNPDNTDTPVLEADGDWDIVFTEFAVDLNMGAWYNGYQTPGILINKKAGLTAAQVNMVNDPDNYVSFDDITLADAQTFTFSDEIDVVGYGWKKTDVTANPPVSKIVADNFYLIKVSDTEIYKLTFTDYYALIDGVSAKGNVAFKFQLLQ